MSLVPLPLLHELIVFLIMMLVFNCFFPISRYYSGISRFVYVISFRHLVGLLDQDYTIVVMSANWFWFSLLLMWEWPQEVHDWRLYGVLIENTRNRRWHWDAPLLSKSLNGRRTFARWRQKPNFLGLMGYQFSLPMVLRWRASRPETPLYNTWNQDNNLRTTREYGKSYIELRIKTMSFGI